MEGGVIYALREGLRTENRCGKHYKGVEQEVRSLLRIWTGMIKERISRGRQC